MMPTASICPIDYQYRPEDLAGDAGFDADIVYAVGGLYGNVESLSAVLRMKDVDEQRTGATVQLVFNGDFHWLDCDEEDFAAIEHGVARHRALRGNVETELALRAGDAGCGCAYPDHVDPDVVTSSNEIMTRLGGVARRFPAARERLATLPMHLVACVAGRRIGLLHGDPQSLAGWGFAVEAMPPPGADGVAAEHIGKWFDAARVVAFACTHTGLPYMQDFPLASGDRLIANNGAAGLPNFAGTRFGLLTRITHLEEAPRDGLYGTVIDGVRFDALPIRYDVDAWSQRFARTWPTGSVGSRTYGRRIESGPDFCPERARRFRRASGRELARG